MKMKSYDLEGAWSYLVSIKEGGGGQYGFDVFFESQADRSRAKYLLAERQSANMVGLFCEDFFLDEILLTKPAKGKMILRSVFDDILARRGEWKD